MSHLTFPLPQPGLPALPERERKKGPSLLCMSSVFPPSLLLPFPRAREQRASEEREAAEEEGTFITTPRCYHALGLSSSLRPSPPTMSGKKGAAPASFKVVLLGEGCVGKTSCAVRFVEGRFSDKHVTTLQASFMTKKLTVRGKRVTLNIWDTAGQERFHALGPIYYRDADGAVLVYDVTAADTFQKVKIWVKELRKMLGADISLAIAGNKSDLDEEQRRVDVERAEEYAKSVGAHHFLTSAKTGDGVEEAFQDLTQRMMASADDSKKRRRSRAGDGGGSASSGRNITIVDDAAAASESENGGRRKPKCCGGGGGEDLDQGDMPVDNSLAASSQ